MFSKAQISTIKTKLNQRKSVKGYVYTVFGTKIQEDLEIIFNEMKLGLSPAKDKNEFPDFSKGKIAYEVKSSVSGKRFANDMGTLNSFGKKLRAFSSIYVIFIEYKKERNVDDRVVNIFFAPIWEFIGKNKDDVLSYREKDGNLRPKKPSDFSPWKSHVANRVDFEKMLDITNKYRSARIVKKHSLILGKTHQQIEEWLNEK